jgi:hypothetical protein
VPSTRAPVRLYGVKLGTNTELSKAIAATYRAIHMGISPTQTYRVGSTQGINGRQSGLSWAQQMPNRGKLLSVMFLHQSQRPNRASTIGCASVFRYVVWSRR